MAEAAKLGVDKTMSECVSAAKHEHPYENRDGFLEASTQVTDHAHVDGMKVHGSWGATANYALFIEIGTSRIGATAPEREQAGGGDMWSIPNVKPAKGVPVLQSFTIVPHGDGTFHTEHRPSVRHGNPGLISPRPFLRPAADRHYRFLAGYIGLAYRGERL